MISVHKIKYLNWFYFFLAIIFLTGCIKQPIETDLEQYDPETILEEKNVTVREIVIPEQPAISLGTFCYDENECLSFCNSNRGRCILYCNENPRNEFCQKRYPIENVRPEDSINNQQERPILSLPFDEGNESYDLLPMGETISHNGDPHAGIDFFWEKEANVIASLDGEIVYIKQRLSGDSHEGVWDIFVRTGKYVVGYTELSLVNTELYSGKNVKKGEWLGNSWDAERSDGGMIHWEFGYYPEEWQLWTNPNPKPHPDRLCPVTYFDEDSRKRIDKIWSNTKWDHLGEFPHICSGIYENKVE